MCVLGVGGRGTFCARIKMRGMETNHGNMHFVGVRFLVLFVGGITVMERQGCDTVTCPAFTPTPPPTMFCLSLFSFLFVTDLPNVCCLKCKCVVLCISLCVVGGGGGHVELGSGFVTGECNSSTLQTALFFKLTQCNSSTLQIALFFKLTQCNSSTLQTTLFFKISGVTSFFNLILGVGR